MDGDNSNLQLPDSAEYVQCGAESPGGTSVALENFELTNLIKRPRGRPTGSKNKAITTSSPISPVESKSGANLVGGKRRRGRPVGSTSISHQRSSKQTATLISEILNSPHMLASFLEGKKCVSFDSKDDIKRFVIDWSMSVGKAFKVLKSSQRRYEVGCPWQLNATTESESTLYLEKDKLDENLITIPEDIISDSPPAISPLSSAQDCPFKLSLNFSTKANGWNVRTYIPHSCPTTNKLRKVPVHWILEKFKSLYQVDQNNVAISLIPTDISVSPEGNSQANVAGGEANATIRSTLTKPIVESFTPSRIQAAILESFNIEIPYPSAWKCLSLLQQEYGIDVHAQYSTPTDPFQDSIRRGPGRPKKAPTHHPMKDQHMYGSATMEGYPVEGFVSGYDDNTLFAQTTFDLQGLNSFSMVAPSSRGEYHMSVLPTATSPSSGSPSQTQFEEVINREHNGSHQ